ncbi:MAG: hypothetical protein VR65_21625 [Desulfobulbaceae bacterium BRH_c16a]|nr:MAG: hypothetical protein VR65_21625 [Desulfobulbaceae bacterium BRH_c16a]
MLSLSPELVTYTKYLAPPLVGAFIGYLTNRVAIRMLFRPLNAWKILGKRVPMTPGVIPAKREDLAKNMGEVVGDHLLTGKEIGKGLQHEVFQRHLYNLIHERMEGILHKDLGTLASTVPAKFQVYFDVGRKTLSYQMKDRIHSFIGSAEFKVLVEQVIGNRLDLFLENEAGAIFTGSQREVAYSFIEKNIAKMFGSETMEQWVEDTIHQKVYGTLQQEKSLADLLPESLIDLLGTLIANQTPALLNKVAALVSEPEVRDKIVKGACAGVDNFINSLGGMADMVRGFLPMDKVEEKIRRYLIDKNDDIIAWLQSEAVQARVVAILKERSHDFLQKPIVGWIKAEDDVVVTAFCEQCTRQIVSLLKGEEVPAMLTSMLKTNIENHLESGDMNLQQVGSLLLGDEAMESSRTWLIGELSRILQSPATLETIDSLVDVLIASLLQKRLGKLANLIPAGVREGLARSLQKMASGMLETEVPGLVQSLNIKKIVTEKVNSLDILKLEGLLLSIMEEQFKYINLFGALLGFLIGCGNIFLLYGF